MIQKCGSLPSWQKPHICVNTAVRRLLSRVFHELFRIAVEERAGRGAAVARPVGFARGLDPKERVHERIARIGGRRRAERRTRRIAPLPSCDPLPLRLVSITKCLPPTSDETCSPYCSLSDVE